MHKWQAGLVTGGTLTASVTGATTSFTNVCLWPESETSALGVGGLTLGDSVITAWRMGEAATPRPDDKWTIANVSYLISHVSKRHNHDEAAGYAIYDCAVRRAT